MPKRILLVLLSAILALSMAGCAPSRNACELATRHDGQPDAFFNSTEADITLEQLTCTEFNTDEFFKACNRIASLGADPDQFSHFCDDYRYVYRAMERAVTLRTQAQLSYSRDLSDAAAAQKHQRMSDTLSEMTTAVNKAMTAALRSELSGDIAEYIGSLAAESFYAISGIDFDALCGLQKKETELVMLYEGLYLNTTVQYNGKTYDFSSDFSDTSDALLLLQTKYFESCCDIYARLVRLRRQLAAVCGYDDYRKYSFNELFGRHFTSDEITAVRNAVKAFSRLHADDLQGAVPNYRGYSLTANEVQKLVRESITGFSSELGRIYADMTDRGLLILSDSDNSDTSSYTARLPLYNRSVIYSHLTGTDADIDKLIHEFGHYANFALGEKQSTLFDKSDLDLCEVNSTALEYLLSDTLSDHFGSSGRQRAGQKCRYSCLIIIYGCVIDEAEQLIYEAGDISTQDVKEIFNRVFREYGLCGSREEYRDWVNISHLFSAPCYYISYALSGIAAQDIYTASLDDSASAGDIYMSFLNAPFGSSLKEVCDANGMNDVFSAQSIEKKLRRVYDYSTELLGDVTAAEAPAA